MTPMRRRTATKKDDATDEMKTSPTTITTTKKNSLRPFRRPRAGRHDHQKYPCPSSLNKHKKNKSTNHGKK